MKSLHQGKIISLVRCILEKKKIERKLYKMNVRIYRKIDFQNTKNGKNIKYNNER